MRYFNYKVKTKLNTPKIAFTAVASLLYTQALCQRVNINITLKLYYTINFVVLHVKLQTKQEAQFEHYKKRQQNSPLSTSEHWEGGKETVRHVLPRNSNTTFNSTVSVQLHTCTMCCARTLCPVADNVTTLLSDTIFQR